MFVALVFALCQSVSTNEVQKIAGLYQRERESDDSNDEWTGKFLAKCKENVDICSYSVVYFVGYLMSRAVPDASAKGDRRKFGSQSEYKSMIEEFLLNFFTLFGEPEWPVVDGCSGYLAAFLAQRLEAQPSIDCSIRSLCIDWMTAFSVRALAVPVLPANLTFPQDIASFDIHHILNAQMPFYQKFQCSYVSIIDGLQPEFRRPAMCYQLACWAANLPDELEPSMLHTWLDSLAVELNSTCEERALHQKAGKIQEYSKYLVTSAKNKALAQKIVPLIAKILDSEVSSLRIKALKSLDELSACQIPIHQILHDKLFDPSASVRDAAVEIIGKSILSDGERLQECYQSVADRILV